MNGHDSTREQNMEARMMLAVARRGLAAAINDAENGIGHLSCDDPQIMEQVRAHWRRLYDTYMNADALLSDLESCARHLTDGDKWEPNPIADGMKPMEMAKGCACFIAETPDGGLIIPSEPTPGENTAKRLANTLNALTGDVLLDATGIRLLGTQFLFAYHSRLDRPVDYGVNLTGMRFPDRLGLLDRADRHPGFLPLRPVVANGTGALERSGRELWAWARWVDSKGRAHTRPDRRYPGFRNQYDGLELLHLRVDENRVLCTDFDQYHCVINRCPCAPLDAGTWPPEEYDRWLDEHWDDPAERKRLQYRANAIADPKRLPDRWIQACLWTITPHDVVDIRPACGKPDTIGNHG